MQFNGSTITHLLGDTCKNCDRKSDEEVDRDHRMVTLPAAS